MNQPSLFKGIIVGSVSGLAAGWVMNQFQKAWTRTAKGFEKSHGAQSMQPVSGSSGNPQQEQQEDDATEKLADILGKQFLGRHLDEQEKSVGGQLVHYAFSAGAGAIYGAMAEVVPSVSAAGGIPFGAAFWVIADETVTPLMGLSKGPSHYPVSTHAYSLSAHLVYGLTAETGRRTLRKFL